MDPYKKDKRDVIMWHVVLYAVALAFFAVIRYMGAN